MGEETKVFALVFPQILVFAVASSGRGLFAASCDVIAPYVSLFVFIKSPRWKQGTGKSKLSSTLNPVDVLMETLQWSRL